MTAREGTGTKMFLRLLLRSALVRRGRALTALLAVTVAATVATALLNLYVDVEAKLRREFRNYGANIVVVAKNGTALPQDALTRVEAALAGHGMAVPYAYAVVKRADGSPIVAAGTDFERVRKMNSFWSVSSWPQNGALVGVRALPELSPDSKPFQLTFEGRSVTVAAAGTLRTGAAEDSRVYLPLADFTRWTGVAPSTIEIAATGSSTEIETTLLRISAALPQAEVRPVRQIVEAEARVLGKTRAALLAAVALIILTTGLSVLATLTARVLDRRKDFAVMKALGASERLVNAFFAAEAAVLGVIGAVVGYGLGVGLAAWIGRVNFHAAIAPRLSVFPPVLAGSVLVALISAAIPISLLRGVQPASILRGE